MSIESDLRDYLEALQLSTRLVDVAAFEALMARVRELRQPLTEREVFDILRVKPPGLMLRDNWAAPMHPELYARAIVEAQP